MSRRRLIVSRRLRGKLTPPSTADIIIAAVVDGGLSVQVIPHQAEELWVWEMDQFGECAGRINQILCDVNCKDDNEMKYFNNLPIAFAIFSSAPPLVCWAGAHFHRKLLHFVRPTRCSDASVSVSLTCSSLGLLILSV